MEEVSHCISVLDLPTLIITNWYCEVCYMHVKAHVSWCIETANHLFWYCDFVNIFFGTEFDHIYRLTAFRFEMLSGIFMLSFLRKKKKLAKRKHVCYCQNLNIFSAVKYILNFITKLHWKVYYNMNEILFCSHPMVSLFLSSNEKQFEFTNEGSLTNFM